jgi:hypothetical protein
MPNGLRWIALVIMVAASAHGFSAAPGCARPFRSSQQTTVSDGRPIGTATGPGLPNRRCRSSSGAFPGHVDSRWRLLWSKRHDGEKHEASFSIWNVLLTPTPGIPDSLALVLPLSAILYAVIMDPSAAFATTILFALLRTAAIRLVLFPTLPDDTDAIPVTLSEQTEQEDLDERNRIERLQLDVFCAGIAAATALLVGPDFYQAVIVASIAAGALLLTTVKDIVDEEQLNRDDKLLNRWDKRIRTQMGNNDSNDDTDRQTRD